MFALIGLAVKAIVARRRRVTLVGVPAERAGRHRGSCRAPVAAAKPHRPKIDPVNVALTTWGLLVYAFLFLPILVIVVYSFNIGRALESWGDSDSMATTVWSRTR